MPFDREKSVFVSGLPHGSKLRRCIIAGSLAAALCSFTMSPARVKIYIIGDSTVCNYNASQYPMTGWGQVFAHFFKAQSVEIINRAIGGRSSRMFYTEGRWDGIGALLSEGDYVFIQFGHNDRDYSKAERYTDTADFKRYLRLYVEETRAKGAVPVLVSPMNMNAWNGDVLREVFCEGANDYRGAMVEVATALEVPFIDLEKRSAAFMKSVGKEYCTRFHFLGLEPGEYPNYPDGKADGTHFQEMGALANARMVAEGLAELSDDVSMKPLCDLLAPRVEVAVASNKQSGGTLTKTADFPSGVTLTLKVVPSSGETFEGWVDQNGEMASSDRMYMFTLGDGPCSFTAKFVGGTTSLRRIGDKAYAPAAQPHYPGFNAIETSSGALIRRVTLFDATGKRLAKCSSRQNLRTKVTQGAMSAGLRIVSVETCGGVTRHPVVLP